MFRSYSVLNILHYAVPCCTCKFILLRCRFLGEKRETGFNETNYKNSTQGERSAKVSKAVYLRLPSTTMDYVKKKNNDNVENVYVEQIFP